MAYNYRFLKLYRYIIQKIIVILFSRIRLKEKKTKIALNQVFVLKLALMAKSHKNSIQGVGFRI